jgi:hypothetical protein
VPFDFRARSNVLEMLEIDTPHLDSHSAVVFYSVNNNGERTIMSRADASGFKVGKHDIPIIIGMVTRGDRRHDIVAWFGLNQGRVKNTQDGKYGPPATIPALKLPPKGPPGIKGRRLRDGLDSVVSKLKSGDSAGALAKLQEEIALYDADEV